jgi:hypothetical protein
VPPFNVELLELVWADEDGEVFELVGDVVEGLVVAAPPVVLVEFGSIIVLGDC